MKPFAIGRNILFSAALVLVITFTGACATLPPQVRPTSPQPFIGEWRGTWQEYGGPNGTVEDLTVEPGNDAQFYVKLTNAVVPGFGGEAKFVNGELVVDRPTLSMVFRLHSNNRLQVTYHNRRNNAKGEWSLARKEK